MEGILKGLVLQEFSKIIVKSKKVIIYLQKERKVLQYIVLAKSPSHSQETKYKEMEINLQVKHKACRLFFWNKRPSMTVVHITGRTNASIIYSRAKNEMDMASEELETLDLLSGYALVKNQIHWTYSVDMASEELETLDLLRESNKMIMFVSK